MVNGDIKEIKKPRRGKVKEKEEIFTAILCNHTVAEHTILFSWAQFKKKKSNLATLVKIYTF